MTLTNLKRQVKSLKLEDRLDLADFIAKQDQASSAARRARIERRMKSMDRGRKITQEQLLTIHTALKSLGL
jgi:hypothetical protein